MPTKSWSSPTSNISKNTTIKLPSAICSDSGSDKQQQRQKQHASIGLTAHPCGVGIGCPSRRRRRQRRRPTHAAGRPVRTTNGFQVLSQSTPGLARQRPMLKRGEHDTEKMPGRALTDDKWMILAMVSRFNSSRKRPKTQKVSIHRWFQSNSATAKRSTFTSDSQTPSGAIFSLHCLSAAPGERTPARASLQRAASRRQI